MSVNPFFRLALCLVLLQSTAAFSASDVPVRWTAAKGVSVSGGSLTKTAPEGWGNAAAVSVQTLSGDGEVKFEGTDVANNLAMCGFSASNVDSSWERIDFALFMHFGELRVYEKGEFILQQPVGTYTLGDELSVERKGSTILYKKNGMTLYTSKASSSGTLLVDSAIYSLGGNVTRATLTSGDSPTGSAFWTATKGVSVSGGTITKTAPEGWGNAGAVSVQTLSGDGEVEFEGTDVASNLAMCGLSANNVDSSWERIDFALFMHFGELRVYEKGEFILQKPVGTYTLGDKLSVERKGSTIIYKKNGMTLHTSDASSSGTLFVDTAIYNLGGNVTDATLTLGSSPTPPPATPPPATPPPATPPPATPPPATPPPATPPPVGADDFDTIRLRLINYYHSITITSSVSGTKGLLKKLNSDGSWDDINYSSKSSYELAVHIMRLRVMAVAYTKPGDPLRGDAALLAGIQRVIDFWYLKNPPLEWWWNQIGQQQLLAPTALMMGTKLTPSQTKKILADLPRVIGDDYIKTGGANLTWISEGVAFRGVLLSDSALVQVGIDGMRLGMLPKTGDGIQDDFSFHAHKGIFYSAGYGTSMIRTSGLWANVIKGTSFAFTSDEVKMLTKLLLDGDRWMVRGSFFDLSATGRNIARGSQGSWSLIDACTNMAEASSTRVAEFSEFKAHIQGKAVAPLTGNKHFWVSDFMTHQRPAYYSSVLMDSTRTTGTETMNGENLKGYWLANGVTFIVQRGNEYEDIAPVWDWAHLPGVTNPEFFQSSNGGGNDASFVGGASNGKSGVAAMILKKASTSAHKSWFFFNDEFVALGAGITSSYGARVTTTLNQSHKKTGVLVDGAPLAGASQTTSGTDWVLHDGVGYVLLEQADLTIRATNQTGSWFDINDESSAAPITKPVFTLFINHGYKPKNATYQYAVVPGMSSSEMSRYVAQPPVRVLANRPDLQAVRHDPSQVAGLAFFQAGTVAVRSGLSVGVDQPSLVLIEESGTQIKVTVSNPNALAVTVNVSLMQSGTRQIRFNLPAGGESVTQSVTR